MDMRTICIFILSFAMLLAGCAGQEMDSEAVVAAQMEEVETTQSQLEFFKQIAMQHYWNHGSLQEAEELFAGQEFRGKYDVIEHAFLEAYKVEPADLDLLFAVASAQAAKGEFASALDSYNEIITQNPLHFEAHLMSALYSELLGDIAGYDNHLKHLSEIDEERAEEYQSKLERTLDLMEIEMKTEVDSGFLTENHAFIVLGFALTDEGEMQQPLLNRLELALAAADEHPQSRILVSGGARKNGVTEADLMFNWLLENGLAEERIIKEGMASNTVENALYSMAIVISEDIREITLVSSPGHIRRALTVFEEASRILDSSEVRNVNHLVYMSDSTGNDDNIVTHHEKAAIYRDLVRTSGIWLYPGIQR